MRATEPVGNRQIAKYTGLEYDWFMGALLLSRRAASRFVELQSAENAQWVGGQMAAAARCIREGMKSGSYPLEGYFYPKEQREIEENSLEADQRRQRILAGIVDITVKEWTHPTHI